MKNLISEQISQLAGSTVGGLSFWFFFAPGSAQPTSVGFAHQILVNKACTYKEPNYICLESMWGKICVRFLPRGPCIKGVHVCLCKSEAWVQGSHREFAPCLECAKGGEAQFWAPDCWPCMGAEDVKIPSLSLMAALPSSQTHLSFSAFKTHWLQSWRLNIIFISSFGHILFNILKKSEKRYTYTYNSITELSRAIKNITRELRNGYKH